MRSRPATPVVDPTTAISTHLSEVIRTFLPDLLTRQQTKELVDRVAEASPKLVEELVPKVASIGDVQRVLRQLLRERVPVRDLTTFSRPWPMPAVQAEDPDGVVETVRMALGRSVSRLPGGERRPARNLAQPRPLRILTSLAHSRRSWCRARD